jgi:hypothetical protein
MGPVAPTVVVSVMPGIVIGSMLMIGVVFMLVPLWSVMIVRHYVAVETVVLMTVT